MAGFDDFLKMMGGGPGMLNGMGGGGQYGMLANLLANKEQARPDAGFTGPMPSALTPDVQRAMALSSIGSKLGDWGRGMAQASGPSRMPVSFGQASAQAGDYAKKQEQERQDSELKRLMLGMELKKLSKPDYKSVKGGEKLIDPETGKVAFDGGPEEMTPYQRASLAQGGGATGVLIDRLMKDNPNMTFSQALYAVQTGYRQGMGMGKDGGVDNLPRVTDAKGDIKESEARGTEKGKAVGAAEGAAEKKVMQAPVIADLLTKAEALLPKATSGGAAVAGRNLAGFFGSATEGSEIDSQLDVIGASLTSGVPRMEGPQSNYDVTLYEKAAGDLANSSKPRETRLAAIKTLRELNNKYANQGAAPASGAAPAASGNAVSYQDYFK